MPTKLTSPGASVIRETGVAPGLSTADVGKVYVLGIAEWGEIGRPISITNANDVKKKLGGEIAGYYGKRAVDVLFEQGGISEVLFVRTAHYIDGVLQASKAATTVQGCNTSEEDRTLVDTLTFTATGEGEYGNRVSVSNVKASTVTTAEMPASAQTSVALDSVTGIERGDVVDIADGTSRVRVVVTAKDTATKTIYFAEVTLTTAIASGATVKTPSVHKAKTRIYTGETLESDATSIKLASVSGIEIGSVLSFIDTQTGAPNIVNVVVTSVVGNTVSFADVETITSITAANSFVCSQEFNVNVLLDGATVETFEYLSMSATHASRYIVDNVTSDYVTITDEASTEDIIGEIPNSFEDVLLAGGTDGLENLDVNDFIGNEAAKTGVYAFKKLPEQFAQIIAPDCRWASGVSTIIDFAEARRLLYRPDYDFGKTEAEAIDFIQDDVLLDSEYAIVDYPHLKRKNPLTNVVETIPYSAFTAGLAAYIWSNFGVWMQPAGYTHGIYSGVVGMETENADGVPKTNEQDVRDTLYANHINPIIYNTETGEYTRYGIRTSAKNSSLTQEGETVTFLFCEHTIKNANMWVLFSNIDNDMKTRLKASIYSFLKNVWESGGLKGASAEDAFIIDLDSMNTTETEERGEFWARIGLATKKAGEFIYFVFSKKV